MKIGTRMDPSLATTSSSAPVGFLLFGPQESSRRRQGRNADGLREMFRRAPSPNFLTASGSSLRPCGEAGTTWQVRTVSRGTREERIRPGTPSRAPVLLLDSVGGRSVPALVRELIARFPDGWEPRLTPVIQPIGSKVQWISRDLY